MVTSYKKGIDSQICSSPLGSRKRDLQHIHKASQATDDFLMANPSAGNTLSGWQALLCCPDTIFWDHACIIHLFSPNQAGKFQGLRCLLCHVQCRRWFCGSGNLFPSINKILDGRGSWKAFDCMFIKKVNAGAPAVTKRLSHSLKERFGADRPAISVAHKWHFPVV